MQLVHLSFFLLTHTPHSSLNVTQSTLSTCVVCVGNKNHIHADPNLCNLTQAFVDIMHRVQSHVSAAMVTNCLLCYFVCEGSARVHQ